MGQLRFFDADRRLATLSGKGDPLEAIASLVSWESFRADIEAAVATPEEAKKSKAGRRRTARRAASAPAPSMYSVRRRRCPAAVLCAPLVATQSVR